MEIKTFTQELREILEDACCNYYHPNSRTHEVLDQAITEIKALIKKHKSEINPEGLTISYKEGWSDYDTELTKRLEL